MTLRRSEACGCCLVLHLQVISKHPNQTQLHYHMETTLKQGPQECHIIVSFLCTLFPMRCPCRSVCPSPWHSICSQNKFGLSHGGCGSLSVFHLTCLFTIRFLMFPHVFVFFHIGLHQISHLHRVDLSALAVADLQGVRKPLG